MEFTTELSGNSVLIIPPEIAGLLPRGGMARIIVLTEEASDDAAWQQLGYDEFLKDDSPEDAIYDSLR